MFCANYYYLYAIQCTQRKRYLILMGFSAVVKLEASFVFMIAAKMAVCQFGHLTSTTTIQVSLSFRPQVIHTVKTFNSCTSQPNAWHQLAVQMSMDDKTKK